MSEEKKLLMPDYIREVSRGLKIKQIQDATPPATPPLHMINGGMPPAAQKCPASSSASDKGQTFSVK